jgi:hypothetical protein
MAKSNLNTVSRDSRHSNDVLNVPPRSSLETRTHDQLMSIWTVAESFLILVRWDASATYTNLIIPSKSQADIFGLSLDPIRAKKHKVCCKGDG